MIVRVEDINIDQFNKKDAFIKDTFYFDIETTGLSHKYSFIISISVIIFEDNYKIYQLFCENKPDEREIIKYFKDLIKDKKFAVTYNGNSFDIPFIINRAQQYNINFNFSNIIKIDIYNDMRNLKNKLNTDDLKLKSVEKFFNINRNDTLSGEDIITLYKAYRIEPRKEFMELILYHNYEDVFNLPLLLDNALNLYDKIFLYKNLLIKINFTNIKFKKNSITGHFNVISDFKTDYYHPSLNFDLFLNIKEQTLTINFPVNLYNKGNIENLYYLDNNDINLKSYTSIEGLRKNIIPFKFNDLIFNDNIIAVISNILNYTFE